MENKQIEIKLPKEEKRLIVLLDALGFKSLYRNEKTKALDFIYWLKENNNYNVRQLTSSSYISAFSPDLCINSDQLIFSLPIIGED